MPLRMYLYKSFLFFIALALHGLLHAQPPGWQWAQNGGGSGYAGSTQSNPGWDRIRTYGFDSEGNFIIGGDVSWAPRFDTIFFSTASGSTNWNGPTMYLAKYNSCGDVQWASIAGGNSSDYMSAMAIDKNDNIYSFGVLNTTGITVTINCPDEDTIIPSSAFSVTNFIKWDKNGNYQYIRTYPYNTTTNWGVLDNQAKMLKDGRILAMVTTGGAATNILGNTVYPTSRYLAIFDTLGNVQKLKLIDSTGATNYFTNMTLDENENIYFSFVNVLPAVSILGNYFNPAVQYASYLIKTDTSFNLIDFTSCDGYCGGPLERMNYSNGYLYGSGRRTDGEVFQGDTCDYETQYTVYKVDTSLNLVWSSEADSQSYVAYHTELYSTANTNYIYLTLQNIQYTSWDGIVLNTPGNVYDMTMLKMRTSDGVVESSTVASGNIYEFDKFTHSAIDPRGNPYFMGNFRQSIGVPGDIEFANTGLTSPDFFILKWGLPCTDTLNSLNTPEAPDALIATAFSSTDVNVEWHNNATYRLGFKLYRSPNGLSNWQQIATLPHNVFTYNDGGLTPATTYWYKVTAYTTGGESAFSSIDSATTFGSVCSASITRTNTDSVYTFNANPTGFGTLTYQWSRNGLNFSTAATPSLTLSTPGTYSICVTVTDAANCTATDCDTVIITPFVCNASLSHANADSLYTFTASGTGTAPLSYAWSSNGTAISGGATAQQIIDLPGTYNVCVTITDANSCQSSDCEVITIAAPPVCSTTVSYTVSNNTYNFSTTNVGTAPYTYEWTLDNQAVSSAAAPAIALSIGSNTVCVSVTDANNCKAADCETVIVSGLADETMREVELYPNPVKDVLYAGVWANMSAPVRVYLHDMSGREVFHTIRQLEAGKNLLSIPTASIASGVYELTMRSGDETWRGRIIKSIP